MSGKRRVLSALLGLALLGHATAGIAQTSDRLAAARKLFAEALKDEEQKNYAVALEKFRSVQQVRSTLPVRYRIASCLEELGKLREAIHDFRAIEAERATEPGDADIVTSSRDKANAIERRTPHVALQLSPRSPADAVVTLDGQALAGSALRGEPIAVDPGDHEVKATGTGATPFSSRFNVAEQANLSLQIPLDPAPVKPPPPPPPPPPVETDTSRKTVGIVLVATGGAFAIASVVTLILRRGDINTLNTACPGGACQADRQTELTSTRSRALVEGPLAIVFAGVAVAAGGVGGYFLLTLAPPPPGAAPAPGNSGALFQWQGAF